jgi:nucleolar complex protein 3
MTKLARESRRKDEDDLPSIASHSDDGETWDSGLDDEALSGTDDDADDNLLSEDDASLDSDAEMPYESMPRTRRPDWNEAKDAGVSRLPIKLADGRIQKSKEKVVVAPPSPPESDEEESEAEKYHEPPPARDDVATGARFGRPAVADVVSKGSRKARVQAASEQIASICQEILADPENSVRS